ncbi:m-AAA protease-interacting protein 1, mitochondrial [Mugil cephalus]|uniref:m-AAA protease-interacting protein 1, mitochondrial n=1 Tax=Mugil cephalus TaxID=48193 RepID=UPI001FB57AC0|nr:m-AAA protease-interacting protein 1, mitochondrial [Mugil cephalus]
MALPMLRGCSRFPSTFSFTRVFLNERLVLNKLHQTRLHPSSAPVRLYGSDPWQKPAKKMIWVGIPNPFIWFRTRIYSFLIRTYFDKDFSIEEFTEGAKQAFVQVSRLLSQCQFKALDGLVASDLVGKLEEKCSSLPSNYKEALCADPDDIMQTILGDMGVFYDDNGRKFVRVLTRFWYLTSANLPNDSLEGIRMFKVVIGREDGQEETKRVLTATYEFQREFTKGVPPDWTITRIEHSKLLD